MLKKINHYIKTILAYLVILLLPTTLYAFDTIKNMPSRNTYFTGRVSCLNWMHKNLSQHGIVYLTGYGGIGKTQLAKEYAYINQQKYDLIWWFDLRNDLVVQYETLLTHLSNDREFKKLLHVNVRDIAPDVLIDFTNSLLAIYNCKWLLIFDNAINNKNIKLPKIKTNKHHIIITTREKKSLSENILTLKLFTNNESEKFLIKIHPNEQKDKITNLHKALHNYPLALAQVSEEILMYNDGIESYLKKHYNLAMKSEHMNSSLTQEYNSNYNEVLNFTLQDIEQKDKESAKTLYMLSLLNIELTKELLSELFGKEIEKNIIVLGAGKYGVIEADLQKQRHVLNIHDIIKEEAIKRLNNKDASYKKEIINTLLERFKEFYAKKDFQCLYGLDAANNQITALYAYIDIALENNIIDEGVVNAIITALRLNNVIFNKNADHDLYQQLANKIYSKNLNNIAPDKKALLYASLVFSDSIFASGENLSKFEKEALRLLDLIKHHRNQEELFYIYVNISLFYMFLGDFEETKNYIEKAHVIISQAGSIFHLLQYWYIKAWLCYEIRDIDSGIKAIDNYTQLNNKQFLSQIGKLFARDIKVKLNILIGRKKEAKKEIEAAIKDALIYYNNNPSRILGELEYTKTLMYFQNAQYKLAEKQCRRALNILAKTFGEDIIDLTQAHIYIILGKIAEDKGNDNLALERYKKSLKFYTEKSYGRVNRYYEYGELLSNLCVIYYKQKKYAESKFYFQKLAANFDLDHEIVDKLIKKLPIEYMYKISSN